MFSYEILEDDGIVVLRNIGLISMQDYQAVAPKFFADVRAYETRKLLIDARERQGWDSDESLSLAFHGWTEAVTLFDRIAVVAADEDQPGVAEFFDFFRNAGKDVRRFQAAENELGLDWLKAP